jgi:hypothetical protein
MFTGTLLTALKDKGFNDVKLIESEEPMLEDDYIEVTNKIHIQICEYDNSYSVVKENEDNTFTFSEPLRNILKIINRVKLYNME